MPGLGRRGSVRMQVNMNMLSLAACSWPILGLVLAGVCVTPVAHAVSFSGNAALTSDYVWRGSSQSQGDAAAQAGFKLATDPGFYASVWGSNVDFGPSSDADSEVDFVLGWSRSLTSDLALDVSATRYHYADTRADLDWTEAGATLTYKQNYWLQVGHSGNALASGTKSTYGQLGARLPLDDQWRIEAALGHYWLAERYADSYTHAQVGVVWAFKAPFELRVTWHDTDQAARDLFPGQAGSRVEAALQASF